MDFVLNGELIWLEMLAVRGMTQQMILGWDFCLVHRATVDTRGSFLRFNSGSAPLLSKEELSPKPGMVRLRNQTQIQIDGTVGWYLTMS